MPSPDLAGRRDDARIVTTAGQKERDVRVDLSVRSVSGNVDIWRALEEVA